MPTRAGPSERCCHSVRTWDVSCGLGRPAAPVTYQNEFTLLLRRVKGATVALVRLGGMEQAQCRNPPGSRSNRLKIKQDTGDIVPVGGHGLGDLRGIRHPGQPRLDDVYPGRCDPRADVARP